MLNPPAFSFFTSILTARSLLLPQGGIVNSYERLTENRSIANRRLAEAALRQYSLTGARLSLVSDAGNLLYRVSVPEGGCAVYHPYLGRINGLQLLLRIESSAEHRVVTTYAELALLATLLRDTDLALPEPVPATSGALVPELETGEGDAICQCVLFRWPELAFPEKALRRASHRFSN
jgi:Ser/Thr protein kinase RdoA (MazF antagonist)